MKLGEPLRQEKLKSLSLGGTFSSGYSLLKVGVIMTRWCEGCKLRRYPPRFKRILAEFLWECLLSYFFLSDGFINLVVRDVFFCGVENASSCIVLPLFSKMSMFRIYPGTPNIHESKSVVSIGCLQMNVTAEFCCQESTCAACGSSNVGAFGNLDLNGY